MANRNKRILKDIAETAVQAALEEQSVAELLEEMRVSEDLTQAHPELVRDFLDALENAAREQANHRVCKVVSAVELSKEEQDRVQTVLQKRFGGTVGITCETDPDVLGGLAVSCGDWRYENTVQSKIKQLTKHLVTTR